MAKGDPVFLDGDTFRKKVERPKMEPDEFYGYIPSLPKDLVERQTPTDQIFSLNHFGVPIVDPEEWSLDIGGLVDKPQVLKLDDIKALPKHTINSMHECAGSPVDPTSAKRRISNVEWAGARLDDILREVGVDNEAEYLWSYGPDSGLFKGYTQDYYLKDLPLERVFQGDVILAYELNGEPLPSRHGFPVRLFVPGFYGTNGVKWIYQMVLTKERADSLYTTTLYSDPISSSDGEIVGSKPVWQIAPESIIVHPSSDEKLINGECTVWGWCWGASEISGVDISVDGGETWQPAKIEERSGWSWQKFEYKWRPRGKGRYKVMSRARDIRGDVQPEKNSRNSIHEVMVDII